MKKRLIIITSIFVFVFAIIFNKIINERNVQRLGQTFLEIYEDRLLVESYIYQLTDLFYKKKIALLRLEGANINTSHHREMLKQTSEIADLSKKYASTRFTENERRIFEKLKENIAQLKTAEDKLLLNEHSETRELEKILDSSVGQLNLLSSIQVTEGNLLKNNGRKVLSASYLSVQLEWALLLIITLLFISTLRKKKIFEQIFPKYQLN